MQRRSQRQLSPMLRRVESNSGARAGAAAAPTLESSNAAIAHFTERVDGIGEKGRQLLTGRFAENSRLL